MEWVLSEHYEDEPIGTIVDLSEVSVVLEHVGVGRTSRGLRSVELVASGTIMENAERSRERFRQSADETRGPAGQPYARPRWSVCFRR